MPRGIPGGLIETMDGGVRTHSCAAQPHRIERPLENPRPKGGILTNGERRFSISGEPRRDEKTKTIPNQLSQELRRHPGTIESLLASGYGGSVSLFACVDGFCDVFFPSVS
jgi:hypothetical protein